MRKRLAPALTAGLATAALVLPGAALGGPRYIASKWTASVKVARCSQALDEAVFHGKMRRVRKSERMAMRFTLLQRTGGEGFQPVPSEELGKWHRSRARVRAFGYKQAVRNLAEGAVYKVRVDYRWYDRDGEVVARARRRSASCPSPKALPNLRVRITGYRATSATDTDRYFVKVMNTGRAAAENVPVRFSTDGVTAGTVTVPVIFAGRAKTVTIRAPECDKWVQAQADPDGLIAETWELDNTHQLACQDLKRR